MIIEAAVLMLQLSAARTPNEAKALLGQVKERLGPEIINLKESPDSLGPKFDFALSGPETVPGTFLTLDTVSGFLVRERSRLAEIFGAAPLRPLQLAIVAKFDAEASSYLNRLPRTSGCQGGCWDMKEFKSVLSRISDILERIEQLPSLVVNIAVTSRPPGASVSFTIGADTKVERELDTNGTVANLYLGDYTVKILKKGYRPKELHIRLLDEPLTALSCTLRGSNESAESTCEQRH